MGMKDEPNKITATLKVVITGEFYDDEASKETLRYCVEQDLEDVGFDAHVELLQEQQVPVKPYLDFDGHDVWRCGKCHTTIFHVYELTDIECEKKYAQYCRHCGRRVKWDDQKTQAEAHQADHPLSGVLALEPDQHA